jgi:glycerol-3-phosphate acyltransferase PlsY
MAQPVTRAVGAAVLGYAIGTIPFADIASRLATGGTVDLRTVGSGNPGATNATSVLGKKWGAAVLGADVAKAAVAAIAGRRIAGAAGAHAGGAAAVVGHCFPAWNRFRGGKGIACCIGYGVTTFPAYAPIDFPLAGVTLALPWRQRTYVATAVGTSAWVIGSVVWWRTGRPNGWGPAPTVALPLGALVSTTVVMWRFAHARPPDQAPGTSSSEQTSIPALRSASAVTP